jgi:hypothetical protein
LKPLLIQELIWDCGPVLLKGESCRVVISSISRESHRPRCAAAQLWSVFVQNERRGWVGKTEHRGELRGVPWTPVFWTCSGIVKSPASITSVRSPPPTCFCLYQTCSAIVEPKVPPPTTIIVERPASSRCPGIDLRDVIAEVAAFHVLRERRSVSFAMFHSLLRNTSAARA